MKKLYFTLLSLFAGITISNAQLLLQSNHAPALGDKFRTTDCSTLGVSPGSGGSGNSWNFSSVAINTTVTDYTVVSVPSSSAASYPSASVAVQTGTTSNYSFYSSSSNSLLYWGGNIVVGTYNIVLTFTSASVYAKYPMSFNTTTTSIVGGNLDALGNSGTFTGTCNTTADGTGTLTLPARTFNNVMRVVTTTTLNFTVPAVAGAGSVIITNYEFFSAESKSPLFSVVNSNINITSPIPTSQSDNVVTINSDYQYVGIAENSKEVTDLNLFPNPANGNFNLVFVNENASEVTIEISNSIGQTVKKENLSNTKGVVSHSVDITNLKPGIYFVKVNAGAKSSIKKLTIQ